MKYIFLCCMFLLLGCKHKHQQRYENQSQHVSETIDLTDAQAPENFLIGGIYDDGKRYVTFKTDISFRGKTVYYTKYAEWGCFKAISNGKGNYSIQEDQMSIDLYDYTESSVIGQKVAKQGPKNLPQITLTYHADNTLSDLYVNNLSFEENKREFLISTGKIPQLTLQTQCYRLTHFQTTK